MQGGKQRNPLNFYREKSIYAALKFFIFFEKAAGFLKAFGLLIRPLKKTPTHKAGVFKG